MENMSEEPPRPPPGDINPRTLYVGNLDPTITEELIVALFSQIGPCKGCKIIREAGVDPYAFVEFTEHSAAASALLAMNKRQMMDRELKVNWATTPSSTPKMDSSNHYHIYVGDLSFDIEGHQLREAFQSFGELSDVKIIRDNQNMKSKGYGFVSFVRKQDAETAISTMNGQWLGSRAIKTGWAARRPAGSKVLNYEEVATQSSGNNSTVYCGGVAQGCTEDLMRQYFTEFGTIVDVRTFADKGYAFIRFQNKDQAVRAILGRHGTDINGYTVKCSWGKESDLPPSGGAGMGGGGAPPQGAGNMGGGGYGGYNQYPQQQQGWGGGGNQWSGPPQQQQQWGGGGPQQGWGGAGQQWPGAQQWGGGGGAGGYQGMQGGGGWNMQNQGQQQYTGYQQ